MGKSCGGGDGKCNGGSTDRHNGSIMDTDRERYLIRVNDIKIQ